jgi:co-chaperonin GroES (HSP10)
MTTSETEWKDFNIEPNGNRIYLYLDDIPTRASKIVLADDISTMNRIGTIIKIGPEVNAPAYNGISPLPTFNPGDRVLLGSHSGQNLYLWQFGIINERWRICTRSEILAKVIGEPAI